MGLLALQLATALVVVAVTTVYMLWRHTARRLRQERALAIRVDRDPATAAKRAGTMHGGWVAAGGRSRGQPYVQLPKSQTPPQAQLNPSCPPLPTNLP